MDQDITTKSAETSVWPEFAAERSLTRSALTLDTHRSSADGRLLEVSSQLDLVRTRLSSLEQHVLDSPLPATIDDSQGDRLKALEQATAQTGARFNGLARRVAEAEEHIATTMVASVDGFDTRLAVIEDARLAQSDELGELTGYLEQAFTRVTELAEAIEAHRTSSSEALADVEDRIGATQVRASISALESTVSELSERTDQTGSEVKSRVQEIEFAATAPLAELEARIDAQSDKLIEQGQHIRDMGQRVAETESQIEENRLGLQSQQDRLDLHKTELHQQLDELHEHDAAISEHSETLSRYTKALEHQTATLTTQSQTLENHSETLTTHENSIAELQSQLGQAPAAVDHTDTLATHSQALEDHTTTLADQKQTLEDHTTASVAQSQILSDHTKTLTTHSQTLEGQAETLSSHESSIAELQSRLEQAPTSSVDDAQLSAQAEQIEATTTAANRASQLTKDNADRISAIAGTNELLGQRIDLIEESAADDTRKARQEFNNTTDSVARIDENVKVIGEKVEIAERSLDAATNRINELEANQGTTVSGDVSTEIATANARLDEMATSTEELEASLRAENSELRASLEELASANHGDPTAASSAQSTADEAHSMAEGLRQIQAQIVQTVKGELTSHEGRLTGLESSQESANAQLASFANTQGDMASSERVQQLETKLVEALQTISQLTQLQRRHTTVETQIADTLSATTQGVEHTQQHVVALRSQLGEAHARIERLEHALSAVTGQPLASGQASSAAPAALLQPVDNTGVAAPATDSDGDTENDSDTGWFTESYERRNAS